MARRPLSDQRRLLVELELDENALAESHAARSARPQSAPRRRPSAAAGLVDLRTPSPYKFKQKILSTRSHHGLDGEDNDGENIGRAPAPTARRRESQRPPMPSPLVLIADAIRENAAQRSRVLLEVQDELRRIPPLRRGPTLLSSKAIKMLNRLRSLTLSIVEMVRYFYEQLPSYPGSGGDATVWALQYEFQELFSRLGASDVDILLSFPPLMLFIESLGVSAIRNPFLDGVSLDSSELLLCSCQAMGSDPSRSMVSSSFFQLVVSKLEAFAIQVHRQYPAWQTLPHERVARALLDLLDHENRVNATRLLPSYLRPKGSQLLYDAQNYKYNDREDEDNDSEDIDQVIPRPLAWEDPPQEPPRRKVSLTSPTAASQLLPVPAPTPRSVLETPTGSMLPSVAEPKPQIVPSHGDPRTAPKKAKKLQERSMTLGVLGTNVVKSETKQVTAKSSSISPEDQAERTRMTIAHALDKLPQVSMRSLGIYSAPAVESSQSEPRKKETEDLILPLRTFIVTASTQTLEHSETQTESIKLVSSSTDPPEPVVLVTSSTEPPAPVVLTSSSTDPPEPVLLVSSSTDPPESAVLVTSGTDPLDSVVLVSSSTDPPEPVTLVSSSTDPREPVLLVTSSTDPPEPVILVSSSTDPPEPVILVSTSTDPQEPVLLVTSSTDPREPVLLVNSSTDPRDPVILVSSSTDPPEPPLFMTSTTDPPEPVLLVTCSTDPPEPVVLVSSWTDPIESLVLVDSWTDPPKLQDLKEIRSENLFEVDNHAVESTGEEVLSSPSQHEPIEIKVELESLLQGSKENLQLYQPDRQLKSGRSNLEFYLQDDVSVSSKPLDEEYPSSQAHEIGVEYVSPRLPQSQMSGLGIAHENDHLDISAMPASDIEPTILAETASHFAFQSNMIETEQDSLSSESTSLSDSTSEISRILSLCRDVQVAAIDLNEWLNPYNSSLGSNSTPLFEFRLPQGPAAPCSPTFTLSTRYLERELKMLRRCFRLWVAALAERDERLEMLRVSYCAHRIGRFRRLVLARRRERERIREQERRDRSANAIQRKWRAFCKEQQRRERRKAFHELHRRFHRIHFFTRVSQRTQRRLEARITIQRWWRRILRALLTAENRRREREQRQLRQLVAARHLQGFVREQLLRRRLEEALESNRRLHMMDNLRAMKARQDETKRRQLEAKRLAELKATMQMALREMEGRWKDADEQRRRVCEEQLEKEAQEQTEAISRRRAFASERIHRFLELNILRRRLKEAKRASEAIVEAQRELTQARLCLEQKCRRSKAERLLLTRMIWWKAKKSVEFERYQASEHERLLRLQQVSERDEARQKLHAELRRVVATSRVEAYCGSAQHHIVETTYASRLAVKQHEARRLRRHVAREKIAGFVYTNWTRWLLRKAKDEAVELDRQRGEAEERAKRQRLQHQEDEKRRLRRESERIVAAWILNQAIRVKEKQAAEDKRLAAEEDARVEMLRRLAAERMNERLKLEKEQLLQQSRRREQLSQLQHRKSQMKALQLTEKHERNEKLLIATSESMLEEKQQQLVAQLRQESEIERQRQREIEMQVRAKLVETMLDTQRLVDRVVCNTVTASLIRYNVALQGLVLTALFKRIVLRAWAREACWRWRQFVVRRRAIASITSAALWPSQAVVSVVHDTSEKSPKTTQGLAETRRRELRLFELKCIASARKIQRAWAAWRKQIRQRRRLEVKRSEDALIAHAKPSAVDEQTLEAAATKVERWFRVERRKNQWRFRVALADHEKVEILFAGGRTLARYKSKRLRLDGVVTRKLLQALDPAMSSTTDVSHVLHELALDLVPIFEADVHAIDGSPETSDVGEMELPRFCSLTRQLSKTRSMLKRTQLLDAKAAASSAPSTLTVWDAVESASIEDAHFLLLQGADLHAREPSHQRTALHMLAFSSEPLAQRVAILEFLVDKAKLDASARDDSGNTPLMLFATRGCVGLVEALMRVTPSQELWRDTNAAGRSAFHQACEQDQLEVALVLQQSVMATKTSEDERRELLLAVYGPDASGMTPIHALAAHGHIECLRHLLSVVDESSRELLVDLRGADGLRPLHLAVSYGHLDLARLVLEHKASVQANDNWQRFPLHFATQAANAVDLISLLVEFSADLNAPDERGDSALHWAAAAGKTLVVRHLLVLGADPTVLNGDWETPAQIAAYNGHADCRRMLLPASSPDGIRRGNSATFTYDPTQEAPSAKSYYLPNRNVMPEDDGGSRVHQAKGEIDWDEIHRDVELVEESGQFSSEDELENDANWSSDDD